MSNVQSSNISKSYAKALIEITVDSESKKEKSARVLKARCVEVNSLLEILFVDPAVEKFLNSSLFTIESKKDLVKKLIKLEGISPVTVKFLMVVLQQGRAPFLRAIFQDFLTLTNEILGVVVVYFESAAPLSKREKSLISKYFVPLLKASEVKVVYTVTPTLIGGFKLQLGSQLVDFSLSTRISQLFADLKQDPAKIWEYGFAYNK